MKVKDLKIGQTCLLRGCRYTRLLYRFNANVALSSYVRLRDSQGIIFYTPLDTEVELVDDPKGLSSEEQAAEILFAACMAVRKVIKDRGPGFSYGEAGKLLEKKVKQMEKEEEGREAMNGARLLIERFDMAYLLG